MAAFAPHGGDVPLGYSDYRSSTPRKPLAGDLVWSVPTLVTLNPIGAPIAHVGLHVSAILHNSDTTLFLRLTRREAGPRTPGPVHASRDASAVVRNKRVRAPERPALAERASAGSSPSTTR